MANSTNTDNWKNAAQLVSGNVANFGGGGIDNANTNANTKDTISISNSTFSNNDASYGGGFSHSGTATISSSTIGCANSRY